MPNFKDKIAKWNLQAGDSTRCGRRTASSTCCPACTRSVWQDYSLPVRTDILQQLNLHGPEDLGRAVHRAQGDEGGVPRLVPVLRPVEQAHPGRRNLLNILGSAYGTPAGWDYQHATWDPAAKKFVYTGAMRAVQADGRSTSTSWSAEKLLDPESFTQTDDQARQKLANGKSFVISGNAQTLVNELPARPGEDHPEREGREDPAADRPGRARSTRPAGWRTAS